MRIIALAQSGRDKWIDSPKRRKAFFDGNTAAARSDLLGILAAKTAGHNAAPPISASFPDHEFHRSV
jgi:hypothetical protein